MKIWERYFFFDTLKVLFFLLFSFSALYVLIDYASHTGTFHHHHIRFTLKEFSLYYSGELIQRIEVLLPFAILVATIRVITRLNQNNELIALLAAGTTMQKLLRPFLWVGLIGVFFIYVSEEAALPWLSSQARSISEKQVGDQSLKLENPAAHRVLLEDGTLLIFQTFNRQERQFFDVWWIPSINELWRIKTLKLDPQVKGYEVERFERNASQTIISTARAQERSFPEIHFNQKRLLDSLTRPEDLALSDLAMKLTNEVSSEKEARIETSFWRKLFIPWLALFAVLGPAPLCMTISRNLNVFFIYAVSMFGLVFIYILLNAATTLAYRQVFSPLTALLVPFSLIALLLTWRHIRLTN